MSEFSFGIASKSTFLITAEESVTFSEFLDRAEKEKIRLQETLPAGSCLALLSENAVWSYARFVGAQLGGFPTLLVPAYQFADPAYRALVAEQCRSKFHFIDGEGASSPVPFTGERHPLLESLGGRPAFMVRTSGSSNSGFKFVLHETRRFIEKFLLRGPHFSRTLAFSPAESIAGIETFLEALTLGRQLVAAGDRPTVSLVADLIRIRKIDYLQTTPTFLNLLLLSQKVNEAEMSSLKKIAYGSEPSSPSTTANLRKILPDAELNHTYGMSEIGIQLTHTSPDDASVFRLDERFNPGRLVNGLVQVKSMTPPLGCLNAELLFDEGFFETGDQAREEHGYWRVLGRQGDLINVAGRKFFPAELENLLMKISGVGDCLVQVEKNEILGQSITAKIVLEAGESEPAVRKRFKAFCEKEVPFFMHPHRLLFLAESTTNGRFKKMRAEK